MSTLISNVVPNDGYLCLVTIANGTPRQYFVETVDEVYEGGLTASEQDKNAYYAMASFKTPGARTQDNVLAVKAFWIDVDCKGKGPTVDYANKDEGIAAIRDFCKQYGFPRPAIVDSGNGWHCYWILTEQITPDIWKPIAEKFKSLCLRSGLRIDPACTADSARILRIPDTKNFRFDPPSTVELKRMADAIELHAFDALVDMGLSTLGPEPLRVAGTPTKKELSAVSKALLNNTLSSFKKIMIRSASGTGCAQLLHAYEEQASLEEPFWRAGLSVAHHCADGATAIHRMSNQHPDYDPTETEEKAAATKGPYTCQTFDGLRANVCTNCPHWGVITSPIQLGKEVIAAQEAVVVKLELPAPEAPPVNVEQFTVTPVEDHLTAYNQVQTDITIPVPPMPFIRGTSGGVYKRTRAEDGTFDDVLVYENDFYAHARLFDPEDGQVLACRLHLPMDGIRNFNVPLRVVGSRDKLREIICKQGIAANDKVVQELSNYLIAMAKELQHMHKEEKARTQMGWQEDDTFVLGSREYSPTGIRHCPPSTATQNYQHMFRMEGTLVEWAKMLDLYDAPGFHKHQFLFFNQVGSPLLKFIREPGMMAAMISDESGIGKSTLGKLTNSVWGHPVEMTSMPHDTMNAIANRMGVLNNLGIYIDELTNKASEQISDVIYMTDHGRGKERLAAGGNVERVNNTRWAQNSLVSANASLRDKISALKAQSEGENMRLFEFDMRDTPVLDKEVADTTFSLMNTNYGVAGHIYAAWMVQNVGSIRALVEKTRREMDKRFGFTSKERKWSASVAVAYTAWMVFYELGLVKWSLHANIEAMIPELSTMRAQVKQSITSHDAVLADFLAENHGAILIANGNPDAFGMFEPPRNRNINRVIARFEPDTDKLYVARKALRDYCVTRQVSYSSMIALTGGRETTKRMTQGTGAAATTSNVVMFVASIAGVNPAALVGESDGS